MAQTCGCRSVSALRLYLHQLQQREAVLVSQTGELCSELKVVNQKVASLEDKLREAGAALKKEKVRSESCLVEERLVTVDSFYQCRTM